MRFHVDLQGAAGMAGHHELDDTIRPPSLGRAILREPEQARLAVGEGMERLADDHGLGTAAADPTFDGAVGMDDAGGARPSGGGTGHGDDRGHDEWATGLLEVGRPGEDAAGHGWVARRGPRRRPSREGSPTPLAG